MNNKGMALVTVILLIAVFVILVLSLSTNSITNFDILKNFKSSKTDFYVDEAANQYEMPNIISISVSNVSKTSVIKDSDSTLISGSDSYNYHSEIRFLYYKNSIKAGTSLNMFSNYFYCIKTDVNKTTIRSMVYKLGPKM